jgi:threonyl-tRNA synthetase
MSTAMKENESAREEFLHRLRHSLAHIMAQAVREIRPDAKLAFGPPVDNGFYYDFDFGDTPIGEDDLEEIENRMRRIIKEKEPFEQKTMPLEEAVAYLEKEDEVYKAEYAKELVETGKAADGNLSFYTHGPFIDMCEGPHLAHTGEVPKGCFQLDRISGSYWRGDEHRPMLTRIYGLAFNDRKALKAWLKMREEAMKRDHRKLGAQLDLFSLHEEGPGFAFIHPNGMVVMNELLDWWHEEHKRAGYCEIRTPMMLDVDLWHRSGHWDNYKENMYFSEIDEREFAVKPMNCPGGMLVYKNGLKSYRDLPIRAAELGTVHRHEMSGVLHGLTRVRMFTQDDAHIFMTPDMIDAEIKGVMDLVDRMYSALRIDYHLELSTRPEKSIGSDEQWELATKALKKALESRGREFQLNEGDGAFYGPKIDFHMQDALGRSWQCATIQLDFSMPDRFDLTYIGSDGEEHRPVLIHRVVFGSIERFFGFLIEHYSGAFPTWLAPVQTRIVPVNDDCMPWAREVEAALKDRLFRADLDESDESFNKKIRNAVTSRSPNIWIVGGQEAESRQITWRRYCVKEQQTVPFEDAIEAMEMLRRKKIMDNYGDTELPLTT